jgi:hypothetical protein
VSRHASDLPVPVAIKLTPLFLRSADEALQIYSRDLVSSTFNSRGMDNIVRGQLWNEWSAYAQFCSALRVPSFPVSPRKVSPGQLIAHSRYYRALIL